MLITCPHCGRSIVVDSSGRKPLNIPLTDICESIKKSQGVAAAAEKLGCSEGYVFKVLKANGLTLRDVRG